MTLDPLDDPDHPTYGMGQAAELLGVTAAFLRSLDTAGLVSPARSGGGHRRYSRNHLARVVALRELTDHGHTLASAATILDLHADLADERARHAATTEERDRARRERDTALDERDTARRQRDSARHERDQGRDDRPQG
jgi:MerR family transcriptional regulator, heat shock protein HspR